MPLPLALSPIALLLIAILFAPLPCRAADEAIGEGGVSVEVVEELNLVLMKIGKEGDEAGGADPEEAAEQQEVEEEAAVEEEGDKEPAEPQPVGKLGIRKGTGRPAGVPAVQARPLAPPAAFAAPGIAGGLQELAVDEQAEQLREQCQTQLRPVLHRELYFVHLVCEPSREERHRLIAAAEPELEKAALVAARRMAAAAQGQAGGMVPVQANRVVIRPGGRATAAPDDPVAMLQDGLVRLVAKQLDQERADRLHEEFQQRVEAQRRAAVVNVVTLLDGALVLSAEQQVSMIDELLAHWREEWETIPQQFPAQYLPNIQLPPAAQQLFTAEQRKRWQSIPKIHFATEQPGLLVGGHGEPADRWKEMLQRLDRAEELLEKLEQVDEADRAGPTRQVPAGGGPET